MSGNQTHVTILACVLLAFMACRKSEPSPPAVTDQAVTDSSGVNNARIMAAALVALPPAGVTAADLPDPQSAGAKLVASVCSGCHNIPSPTAHSATDWPSVVRRMVLRIDLGPRDLSVQPPTMAERQILLQYLLVHSLKVSSATLPAGAGREAFTETCDRCHALPDPRQHSPADWPAVVERMGQRMDQMKVTRGSQQKTQELLMYLQKISVRKS